MFMLAYDDVTDHSIDMEMARLLLEQRIKQEEQAKEEALKAFGAGGTEMEDLRKHHHQKSQAMVLITKHLKTLSPTMIFFLKAARVT